MLDFLNDGNSIFFIFLILSLIFFYSPDFIFLPGHPLFLCPDGNGQVPLSSNGGHTWAPQACLHSWEVPSFPLLFGYRALWYLLQVETETGSELFYKYIKCI